VHLALQRNRRRTPIRSRHRLPLTNRP
jgi:hypothetical protein